MILWFYFTLEISSLLMWCAAFNERAATSNWSSQIFSSYTAHTSTQMLQSGNKDKYPNLYLVNKISSTYSQMCQTTQGSSLIALRGCGQTYSFRSSCAAGCYHHSCWSVASPVLLFPPLPSPSIKHPFEWVHTAVCVSIPSFVPSKITQVTLIRLNRRWQEWL